MNNILRVVVNGLQFPAPGLSVAEARDRVTKQNIGQELPADNAEEMAKAVQHQQTEPAKSTPESNENGAINVKTQPTQEGA
jgi:hypothetical protein